MFPYFTSNKTALAKNLSHILAKAVLAYLINPSLKRDGNEIIFFIRSLPLRFSQRFKIQCIFWL